MALSVENWGWANRAPQFCRNSSFSRPLEATPPEHSTGRPGYASMAALVQAWTTRQTVSWANQAISAGSSPLWTICLTLFSMPDREKVRPFTFTL